MTFLSSIADDFHRGTCDVAVTPMSLATHRFPASIRRSGRYLAAYGDRSMPGGQQFVGPFKV
jgi:hypothetical protein